MQFNKIRNIDTKVSKIGFGAWAMGSGSYGDVSEIDAYASLQTYVSEGGNFIDTARGYKKSEGLIGNFLKRENLRNKIVIASKTAKLDEAGIREEIETSLLKLQTDYIDLYFLHNPPDESGDIDRVLTVFDTLKKEGKIRAIGASVKGPDVTQKTVDLCRAYIKDDRIDALQVIYSIFRQKNSEMFVEAKEAGVAIVARTILESGFLTGKYKPGHEFTNAHDHRHRWSKELLQTIFSDVQSIEDLAVKAPFENVAQIAMRFVLDNPFVTSTIPGAKNADQMKKNMKLINLPALDGDIMTELKKKYAVSGERFNADKKMDPNIMRK